MTEKIRHRGKISDIFAELERDRFTFARRKVSHLFRGGDDLIGEIVLVNVDVWRLEDVIELGEADLFELKVSDVDGDVFEEVSLDRLELAHEQILQLIDTVERLDWACVEVEQEVNDKIFAQVILLVDEAVEGENLDAIVELSVFGTWY